jgi:transitional endoplasmic reticulum ATPase
MGVKPPKGVLLYGPPGCGKTLLARALAAECGANMILVRGPEILSKWVGESEKAIREIFRKAKASAPCVVIFDELDSLAKSKMKDEHNHGETILSQMLTEMEDSGTSNIVIVGITNRPDLIDSSMLRNERLDIVLFVQPPDEKGRLEIIKILTDNMPLATDINLNEIAVSTQNYTGADLASLCREAAVNAMQKDSPKIGSNDFAIALKRVRPSITREIDKWYNDIKAEVSNIIPKPAGETFYR